MPTVSQEEVALRAEVARLKAENARIRSELEVAVRYGEMADDEVDMLRAENTALRGQQLPPALRPVIEPPENTVKPGFDIEPIHEK